MAKKIVLGYWDMRGLAERIQLVMEYMELEYENVKYFYGPPPENDDKDWHSKKASLDLDFPNIPYIIDDDVKMTESWAIMRYLAHKNKNQLYPEPGHQEVRCEMAVGVIHDVRTAFTRLTYDPNFEVLKCSYLEKLPLKLQQFDKFLQGNSWLAGEKLTYVDFAFNETLTRHLMMFPGCLDKYKNLKEYYEVFQNFDAIKAFYNSDRFQKYPINSPTALWGLKP